MRIRIDATVNATRKQAMLTYFMVLCVGFLSAQEVVLASGGEASGRGGTFSYSIGQAIYNHIEGVSGSATGGVQQPIKVVMISSVDELDEKLKIAVFPNPTADYLSLNIENLESRNIDYELMDQKGNRIERDRINESSAVIHMENLPASVYLLRISADNQTELYKIIKTE